MQCNPAPCLRDLGSLHDRFTERAQTSLSCRAALGRYVGGERANTLFAPPNRSGVWRPRPYYGNVWPPQSQAITCRPTPAVYKIVQGIGVEIVIYGTSGVLCISVTESALALPREDNTQPKGGITWEPHLMNPAHAPASEPVGRVETPPPPPWGTKRLPARLLMIYGRGSLYGQAPRNPTDGSPRAVCNRVAQVKNVLCPALVHPVDERTTRHGLGSSRMMSPYDGRLGKNSQGRDGYGVVGVQSRPASAPIPRIVAGPPGGCRSS